MLEILNFQITNVTKVVSANLISEDEKLKQTKKKTMLLK